MSIYIIPSEIEAEAMQATPHIELIAQIMSSVAPKNEREWAASREIERLRAELDTERMRLAACGVVAMADTPESAAEARNMHPDYRSASCDDVARRVDECIRLRAQVEILSEQLTMESIDTTCHCAAKSAADCGCPGAVWPEDTLRSENGRLREALHTARDGLAHIKAVARLHAEGADTALEGRS